MTKVFNELDLVLPSVNEARDIFASYLDEGIIAGSRSADKAHFELYELWRESNYQPELTYNVRLEPFIYLSDSLGLVETGEKPCVNGLTAKNYLDYLKQECAIYLEGVKSKQGEQDAAGNPLPAV